MRATDISLFIRIRLFATSIARCHSYRMRKEKDRN
jgi:hypothetical protein